MNFLRGSLLALGVLLTTHMGFSQVRDSLKQVGKKDTLKLSVEQAKQFAIENNKSVLNSNLDVESAKKKIWEITAAGLPQVNAKGSFQYTPKVSPTVEQFSSLGGLGYWMYQADQSLHTLVPGNPSFGNIPTQGPPEAVNPNDLKWTLNGAVTVTQLIFSGSYLVGLQSAKVYKSLSELNQTKTKQDMLETIVNSYFNVLVAHENRMILDSTYRNLEKTFSNLKAISKQGFVDETDVDQFQITLSSVKNSLDLITRLEVISRRILNLQLGLDLDAPVVLTDKLKEFIDAMTLDKLLLAEFTIDGNVTYKMLDVQVKASELLLKLRKSEFLPELAAFYQYYKEFNNKALSFTPPHVIGAQLNIPIFGSGMKLAKISQAKIDLQKANNNKTQYSDALKLEFDLNKSTLMNAWDKYQTESNNLLLAKKIYDKSLIKYSNGTISNIELTQVQNQFLTVQSNYYLSIQNLIAAKNKLEKMLAKN
jgi:outer membrane protein